MHGHMTLLPIFFHSTIFSFALANKEDLNFELRNDTVASFDYCFMILN